MLAICLALYSTCSRNFIYCPINSTMRQLLLQVAKGGTVPEAGSGREGLELWHGWPRFCVCVASYSARLSWKETLLCFSKWEYLWDLLIVFWLRSNMWGTRNPNRMQALTGQTEAFKLHFGRLPPFHLFGSFCFQLGPDLSPATYC